MTEKSTTGGSAPPYDSNPPYSHTPAQPTMGLQHAQEPYTVPTSPPPQVFSPQPQHQGQYSQSSETHYQPPPNELQSAFHPPHSHSQHQSSSMDGQPYTGNAIGQPGSPQPLPGYGGQEQKGSYYGQAQGHGQGHGQAIPMQGMGQQQQSQYHTAMPLQNLTEGAAPVDCPACRQRALTRTEYVSGNSTIAWAALLCFCCFLGCIPFMMRSLKDVEHHCGQCGVLLATWHNSGRVVVHQHA